jgi:hypothetical protein
MGNIDFFQFSAHSLAAMIDIQVVCQGILVSFHLIVLRCTPNLLKKFELRSGPNPKLGILSLLFSITLFYNFVTCQLHHHVLARCDGCLLCSLL